MLTPGWIYDPVRGRWLTTARPPVPRRRAVRPRPIWDGSPRRPLAPAAAIERGWSSRDIELLRVWHIARLTQWIRAWRRRR